MKRALGETKRRRDIQLAYNKKHGITPKTIMKKIKDITEELESEHGKIVNAELALDFKVLDKSLSEIIKIKEKEMNKMVKELDFETAAILRDEIGVLRLRLEKKS